MRLKWPGLVMIFATSIPCGPNTLIKSKTNSSLLWAANIKLEYAPLSIPSSILILIFCSGFLFSAILFLLFINDFGIHRPLVFGFFCTLSARRCPLILIHRGADFLNGGGQFIHGFFDRINLRLVFDGFQRVNFGLDILLVLILDLIASIFEGAFRNSDLGIGLVSRSE